MAEAYFVNTSNKELFDYDINCGEYNPESNAYIMDITRTDATQILSRTMRPATKEDLKEIISKFENKNAKIIKECEEAGDELPRLISEYINDEYNLTKVK